ncbi:10876_t:CDS:2 [Ambispora gerdemannii]|uniref:10876_t:CDS:1 n=1 Tax=Ambispora gerdemannii TaxID=144530 RepID=A0A9N9B1M2_9GLOM|nr:10876_t:CDS:2 [Ambispora gerdemannii]
MSSILAPPSVAATISDNNSINDEGFESTEEQHVENNLSTSKKNDDAETNNNQTQSSKSYPLTSTTNHTIIEVHPNSRPQLPNIITNSNQFYQNDLSLAGHTAQPILHRHLSDSGARQQLPPLPMTSLQRPTSVPTIAPHMAPYSHPVNMMPTTAIPFQPNHPHQFQHPAPQQFYIPVQIVQQMSNPSYSPTSPMPKIERIKDANGKLISSDKNTQKITSQVLKNPLPQPRPSLVPTPPISPISPQFRSHPLSGYFVVDNNSIHNPQNIHPHSTISGPGIMSPIPMSPTYISPTLISPPPVATVSKGRLASTSASPSQNVEEKEDEPKQESEQESGPSPMENPAWYRRLYWIITCFLNLLLFAASIALLYIYFTNAISRSSAKRELITKMNTVFYYTRYTSYYPPKCINEELYRRVFGVEQNYGVMAELLDL